MYYYLIDIADFDTLEPRIVENSIPKDATTTDGLKCFVKSSEVLEGYEVRTREEAVTRRRESDFPAIEPKDE